jgi:integrase
MNAKFLYNRKKKLNNENKGLIELEIYLSRTNRKIKSTGIYIETKYWDSKSQRIKNNCPLSDELNYKLFDFKNKLEREYLKEYSPVRKKEKTKKKHYFYEYFSLDLMQLQNDGLSSGTKRVYTRVLKYLKEFCPKDFLFENLDVRFLQEFDLFLKNTKGLSNNGRHALFTKIKKAVNLAVLNDVIQNSNNPFKKGFKIKEIPPEKESLSLEELQLIENLDMKQRPELILVRDMFLFSCYTGLRYGDLSKLSTDNFDILNNGSIRLKYNPKKTEHIYSKTVSWIITDFWAGKADTIIKKYLDVSKKFFFGIVNEHYNRQLKELQRFAKIDKKLHSHLARHTCITLLVNDYQLDITKAQLIAGHSKLETTMLYLKIDENDLSRAGKNIKW